MFKLCKNSFTLILLIFLACSCSNTETSYLVELCVVKERGDQSLYLLSDEGHILYPSSSLDSEKYVAGQRFRVTYIKMEGGASLSKDEAVIDIKYMLPVLIKDAVSAKDFTDKNINDPIWLVSQPWPGGGYLNFEFVFGLTDTAVKHGIYLVQDSLVHKSNMYKIYLTFGHDANKDASSAMGTALASFPLNSITDIQRADSLIIYVLEGTKEQIYKLVVTDEFKSGN